MRQLRVIRKKILGINFYTYLTFEKHVHNTTRKSFGTLMNLNRIKDKLSPCARIIDNNSPVLSSINYGIKIRGSAKATQLQRVLEVQRFDTEAALGGGTNRDHATPFLKKLGWMRIENKCKYEIFIMV